MRYVSLGSTGLRVSRVSLGMMSYGSGATKLAHLEDALAAEQLTLSEEEVARLEALRAAPGARARVEVLNAGTSMRSAPRGGVST